MMENALYYEGGVKVMKELALRLLLGLKVVGECALRLLLKQKVIREQALRLVSDGKATGERLLRKVLLHIMRKECNRREDFNAMIIKSVAISLSLCLERLRHEAAVEPQNL